LLLCRFSGGYPAANGDVSGVAKNSYYIENGEIQYPVNECMVSGNIPAMLMNIAEVSAESVNFGTAIYPWIRFGGLTLSGK
jgi:PmbA protein